jgi:hypothetical protein
LIEKICFLLVVKIKTHDESTSKSPHHRNITDVTSPTDASFASDLMPISVEPILSSRFGSNRRYYDDDDRKQPNQNISARRQPAVMVGGVFDAELETQTCGARSVSSSTLDALLTRIERTKAQIEAPRPTSNGAGEAVWTQESEKFRLRGLINNLAKVAEQMQQLGEHDD